MWPSGGAHVVDVRDVARVHAATLTPGAGPRRYLVPGHYVDSHTMFATLRALTGRRLSHIVLPAKMILPVAWAASWPKGLSRSTALRVRGAPCSPATPAIAAIRAS